jgi:hypothetical protein
MSRNIAYGLLGLVLVALIGAYFLFQHKSVNDFTSSAATTTLPSLATTSSATAPVTGASGGKGSIIVGQAPDIKVAFDATALTVGGFISPITLTVPKDADGKTLVLVLKDMSGKLHDEALLATVIHPSSTTYTISGLKLTRAVDIATGAKVTVTAGTYVLQVILWDRTPFGPAGTYTNLGGNNGTGTQSAPFTIAP